MLYTRDNQEIRNIYINIVTRLTQSVKNDLFNNRTVRKVKEADFQREGLVQNIKNQNLDLIVDLVNKNDITEFQLALNEIAYHLQVSKSLNNCIFWYQWIVKLATKKKKDDIELSTNIWNINGINDKYTSDWIWLIWHIIFKISKSIVNSDLKKTIKYLYDLYKIDYKPSQKSKKQYLIYLAFYCCTAKLDLKKHHLIKEHLIIQASINTNIMYQLIHYHYNKNNPNVLDKKEFIIKVKEEYQQYYQKKRKKVQKKKKRKKDLEDSYENNKLSYLDDLLFLKK